MREKYSEFNRMCIQKQKYEFKNDNVNWYKLLHKRTFIETTFDKDVFDPMLIIFFQTDSFLPKRK